MTTSTSTLGRVKLLEAADVAELVKDNDQIVIGGGGFRMVAEDVIDAIEKRFLKSGHPKNLRVISLAMTERTRKGVGSIHTGLNRLAKPGLLAEVVCSSFSRGESPLNKMILAKDCVALCLPMGTILELLRAAGSGKSWYATKIGIGTFIDPRIDGGYLTPGTSSLAPKFQEINGDECLVYNAPKVDVALVKGTSIDERGNLFADKEGYLHSSIYAAMSACNTGGIVVAQANRTVELGEVHPRMGVVPAPFLNYAIISPETYTDEHEPTTNGETRMPIPDSWDESNKRMGITRTVLDLLPQNACVNVGAGIGMYELPEVAYNFGRKDLYFSIEQGPMGGYPRVGGVSRNVEIILDQLPVFDFYEGGGPDCSVLSFAEIDADGKINVSRFDDRLPGCGGFPNIAYGARHLILAGSLTTGSGALKLVEKVQHITYDAARGVARGQKVTIVTDEGVLELCLDGFRLADSFKASERLTEWINSQSAHRAPIGV